MGKAKNKVVKIRRIEELDLDDMEGDEPFKIEEVEIVLEDGEDGEEDDA